MHSISPVLLPPCLNNSSFVLTHREKSAILLMAASSLGISCWVNMCFNMLLKYINRFFLKLMAF